MKLNKIQKQAMKKAKERVLVEKNSIKKCVACNGSGYYDTTNSPTCSSCEGTGIEEVVDTN